MKWVLWKTFARTRTLMVRMPERALEPQTRTLAFLVADQGDEPAAAMLRATVESGLLGKDWRLSADGSSGDAFREKDALPLIVQSKGARDRSCLGLSDFITRSGDGRGRCLLFAPARNGPWLARAEQEIRRRRVPFHAVLVTDGLALAPAKRRTQWLFRATADARTPLDEVSQVVRRLKAAGAHVVVLDRASGRVLGQLEKMRV
jgi:hypothetical protein